MVEIQLSTDVDVRGASSVARHSFEVAHLEVGIRIKANLEELRVEEVSGQSITGVRDGGKEAVNVHLGGVEGKGKAPAVKGALINVTLVRKEQALVGLVEERRGEDEVGGSAVRSLNLAVYHEVRHLRDAESRGRIDELILKLAEGSLVEAADDVVLGASSKAFQEARCNCATVESEHVTEDNGGTCNGLLLPFTAKSAHDGLHTGFSDAEDCTVALVGELLTLSDDDGGDKVAPTEGSLTKGVLHSEVDGLVTGAHLGD